MAGNHRYKSRRTHGRGRNEGLEIHCHEDAKDYRAQKEKLYHESSHEGLRRQRKDNTAYLMLGISHDTSEFVCDNTARVWNRYLSAKYAKVHTILILCDGGGSNSNKHQIVKQNFMELANRLKMNILIIHYPPYCSKYNPIEHRVFPHITREWSEVPLLNLKDLGDRAELAQTKKGLQVIVDYNDRKRRVFPDYENHETKTNHYRRQITKAQLYYQTYVLNTYKIFFERY